MGIQWRDTEGLHQGIQLVGRDDRSVFDVTLLNGKADASYRVWFAPSLNAYVDYYIDLCERWASIHTKAG